MSFGFSEEHEILDDAIQYAVNNRVLMFAAASNDGKNRPDGIAWPARDNNVICVHSADGNGNPSDFTPAAQDGMRIMVLGECVESASPPHLKNDNDKHLMSGTSCAAPIAAGIAAVVLDYARSFLTQREWEKLRRVAAMKRMFGSMTDSKANSEYWWIKHWAWFEPRREEGWIQGQIKGVL
jgi:subtilisin family serine protease